MMVASFLTPRSIILFFLSNMCIWRRQWHPTPVRLPEKSHGRRNLVGRRPWGRKESDTTEWLHFHFSLSCTGERNGNPLQCSCLENPRDGGAWWAADYGVAQSRTRLKWLSNNSSGSTITWSFIPHTQGITKLLKLKVSLKAGEAVKPPKDLRTDSLLRKKSNPFSHALQTLRTS